MNAPDWIRAVWPLMLVVVAIGCEANGTAAPVAENSGGDGQAVVETLALERATLRRATTQPATVHAYFQAEIHARAAGYLGQLNVDIGDTVELGDVLGTIDVPEMVKSRERQLAVGRRLQAGEKRAEAEIRVARANIKSAEAAREQAHAGVGGTLAQLEADRAEFERMTSLVASQTVTDELLVESRKRYDASQAAKVSAEAALLSADARVTVAEAQLAAAEADLDAARADTEVAVKQLEELDAQMAYATIRAPFDGTVTERNVDPGDLVSNQQSGGDSRGPALFVVAQLDRVRVRTAIPEDEAPWADVGDVVTLSLRSMPGQTFEGTIARTASGLDESTRTMLVEIDLPNEDGQLLPGMYGEATVQLEEHVDSLVLPAGVVRYDEVGRSYVYVIDRENKVQHVDVTTGLDDGERIEIVAGLEGDERVATAMIGRLADGQVVAVAGD